MKLPVPYMGGKMRIRDELPGIGLCLMVAAPAYFVGKLWPLIGGPAFSIITGIAIATAFPKWISREGEGKGTGGVNFTPGIGYTSKKLLQISIILLGFEMNLFRVMEVGRQSLLVMLFTLTAAFLTAALAGPMLRLKGKTTVLIGVGTAICGGSAIAATAPVIDAEDDDVVHAISTIFIFNIAAVFLFPALGHWLQMSDTGFGMWAGTAINDTSSVVAAGTSWSATAGNDTALAYATVVKLTRTLMIVPITLFLAFFSVRKGNVSGENASYSPAKIFPWFVLGFIGAAVVSTFAGIPAEVAHFLTQAGKFMIVMAMAAIGLNTNLKRLAANGIAPVLLGLCCWFAVACVSLGVQSVMDLW